MTVQPPGQTPFAVAVMLHRFLGIGVVMLTAIFGGMRYTGAAPLLRDDSAAGPIAYVFAAIVALAAGAAVVVLRPRIPRRPLEQSLDDYWSTPGIAQKVLLVAFLLEGASIFSVVSFLLTGELVAAIALLLSVALFWTLSPKAFAGI